MSRAEDAARYTVSATAVAGLVGYAGRLGIDCTSALREHGISDAALRDPEARVSHLVNHRLWEHVVDASGDHDFGLHMGERMDLDAFHVLGHLAAHSATVGDALARIVAYSRLLHDAGRIETEVHGDELVVYPGCRGLTHDWPRHIAEYSAASVLALIRAITGVSRRASRVGFKHAKPASILEHTRVFGITPVFSVEETFVSLPVSVASAPVASAKAGLSTFLDAYARELLAKLPEAEHADLAMVVRRRITEALPNGLPAIADVAKSLAMTPRTLQRRLGDAGTIFQELLDNARCDLARHYVRDGSIALAEVAFLLGFADPSNFHRAFKRWTGMTPSELRANGANGQYSVVTGH